MHRFETLVNRFDRVGPSQFSRLEPLVEVSALTGALPDCSGGNPKLGSDCLDLGNEGFDIGLHDADCSVIFHTEQRETSHSPKVQGRGKFLTMDENEIFRENLLRLMAEKGMNEAELSIKAGLNRRAVTDIRERRTQSPKVSTVFKLASALGADPASMLGLGRRYSLNAELAEFLSQYGEDDQARFLAALASLPRLPA